jgi:hypothetical protein
MSKKEKGNNDVFKTLSLYFEDCQRSKANHQKNVKEMLKLEKSHPYEVKDGLLGIVARCLTSFLFNISLLF